jgi:hypothetical protein
LIYGNWPQNWLSVTPYEEHNTCIRTYGGALRALGFDRRLEDRPDFYAGPRVRQFMAANNFCAGGVKIQDGSAAIVQTNNLNL